MSVLPLWLKAIIIACCVGALLYGVHLLDTSRQKIGYNQAIAEVTKKENESLKFALAEITRLNNQVMEATDAAKERELEAQKYRDRIVVLDGKLRNAQRSIDLSLANATADALRSATSAFNSLFAECRGKYEEMGRAAHGHSSDVITLEQAWPK